MPPNAVIWMVSNMSSFWSISESRVNHLLNGSLRTIVLAADILDELLQDLDRMVGLLEPVHRRNVPPPYVSAEIGDGIPCLAKDRKLAGGNITWVNSTTVAICDDLLCGKWFVDARAVKGTVRIESCVDLCLKPIVGGSQVQNEVEEIV